MKYVILSWFIRKQAQNFCIAATKQNTSKQRFIKPKKDLKDLRIFEISCRLITIRSKPKLI